jgi:hypothetical protein
MTCVFLTRLGNRVIATPRAKLSSSRDFIWRINTGAKALNPADRAHAPWLFLALSGLFAFGLALALRYGWVEAEGLGFWCAQAEDWRCAWRQGVITLFAHNRLGIFAAAVALLALGCRSRSLAWVGWVAGLMGLALYCFEASAFAVLLALLILARPCRPKNPQAKSNRQSAPQA